MHSRILIANGLVDRFVPGASLSQRAGMQAALSRIQGCAIKQLYRRGRDIGDLRGLPAHYPKNR